VIGRLNFKDITQGATVLFCAFVVSLFVGSTAEVLAHEVDQRVGGYSSTDGEARMMAKFAGRAEAPLIGDGDWAPAVSFSAQIERVKSKDKYMQSNFPLGERVDKNFSVDGYLTVAKRMEVAIGASQGGDSVSSVASARTSFGHWLLGDQLRLGFNASYSKTKRPEDSFLDYDSATVTVLPNVSSIVMGFNLKALLNPTTTVTGDYAVAKSTDRPLLRSWTLGLKQFIDPCHCAVHAESGRVINLGKLNTNMTDGELTGNQWSLSYLQSLWQDAHARISYRYAREDEFTRAYGDHLVFGADSYVAAISQEFQKARIAGAERPLLVDLAATRYIDNKSGSATTFEVGGSVKF